MTADDPSAREKSAAELLREVIKRDPEAHNRSLVREVAS